MGTSTRILAKMNRSKDQDTLTIDVEAPPPRGMGSERTSYRGPQHRRHAEHCAKETLVLGPFLQRHSVDDNDHLMHAY